LSRIVGARIPEYLFEKMEEISRREGVTYTAIVITALEMLAEEYDKNPKIVGKRLREIISIPRGRSRKSWDAIIEILRLV
jgi:hypothetical protein